MSAAKQKAIKGQMRVVSLLPSATEMLALIGAEIVGRSHECDWPEAICERVSALTGAYNKFENSAQMHDAVTESLRSGQGLYWLNSERLAQLRPDVIVTQSLCSVCAVDLDIVRKAATKVFPPPRIIDTNPMSLQDVISDVRRLGVELGLAESGEAAAAALQGRVDRAVARVAELAAAAASVPGAAQLRPQRVVFLEWTDPLFPGGHWTPQMIHMAGGVCPVNPPRPDGGGGTLPSKQIEPSAVVAVDPDLIIVAPCGLDLESTRREMAVLEGKEWWRGLRAVRSGRVALVDGNQHFNRPGPRLVEALEWLVGLLADRHDFMPPGFPWEWRGGLMTSAAEATAEAMVAEAVEAEAAPEKEEMTAEEKGAAFSAIVAGTARPAATPPAAVALITPAVHVPEQAKPSDDLTSVPSSAKGRLRPLGNATSLPAATTAAAAATTPHHASASATATTADGSYDASCNLGEACRCGDGSSGGGGDPRLPPTSDPWVAACSPWATAPHLPADIEDLHAAACDSRKTSYDDPETGFMVFTQLALAKRGHCCANRCRHCPWGHTRVTGKPRQNRITRPTLVHPSPAAARAWKQRQQQQGQQHQQRQRHEQEEEAPGRPTEKLFSSGSSYGGGGGGRLKWPRSAAGGGLMLVAHEGCLASDSVAAMVSESRGTKGPRVQQEHIVLLVAFDVDTGALWHHSTASAADAITACSSGSSCNSNGCSLSSSGSGGGGGSGKGSSAPMVSAPRPYDVAPLGAVMDTSLRLNLDLVAVPLQVQGRTWPRDPAAVQRALSYVVRTAAELLKEPSVGRVIALRPEERPPAMFVQGTTGAVPGGWPEIVRCVNAELAATAVQQAATLGRSGALC